MLGISPSTGTPVEGKEREGGARDSIVRIILSTMLGFSSDARFVEHVTARSHPERPDRIRAVAKAVRDAGLIDSPNPWPAFDLDFGLSPMGGARLLELPVAIAEDRWLLTCHTPEYVAEVDRVCANGGGLLDEGDTPVGEKSAEIARLSLGSLLGCCDAVMAGKCRRAFSAARPPGHHALPDRAMGFCLFANVAIAAKYLQQRHGIERVAIVDFDVHHGNGTQACLEDDPSVLFVSLHQSPQSCWPGSGYEHERGVGRGEGFTLNVPLPPGTDDASYLRALDQRVMPALDRFKPQVLLLSAGFDAHADDPLAQLELTEEGFSQITQRMVQVAEAHCGGRIVSALEGGYNLRALGRSVVAHLLALRD
jgi:acetoin utilization deacetylase AcuC-like enzyme